MRVRRTLLAPLFGLPLAALGPSSLAMTTMEGMNVVSLMEGLVRSMDGLQLLDYIEDTPTLDVTGSFTSAGFVATSTGTIDGQSFSQSYQGTLAGSLGQNIVVNLTSNGTIKGQSFSTSGQVVWNWDAVAGNYATFDYEEIGLLGAGWINTANDVTIGLPVSGIDKEYKFSGRGSVAIRTPVAAQDGPAEINILNDGRLTIDIATKKSEPTPPPDLPDPDPPGPPFEPKPPRIELELDEFGIKGEILPVPEPATNVMLLAGLAAVAVAVGKRRRRL
ncbi:PEP-CTERM sorting domain-containing protein [Caldimonas brevitalea]|uniref:PEP-CTERM sorting domain-containing protein n=1 Tax=Caldimonas brevitalea TaxID=413882 RepID=UPI0009FB0A2F|nr:PEP-CTERM sorting domain-containing protein [Caldimonas brevitalea]